MTVADGLGPTTRSAASSAIALGALRASRRGGATISESLLVMHRTLAEMPGPKTEMTAAIAHWDPTTNELRIANCGHVAPVILREGGDAEVLDFAPSRGLGGRSTPKPAEQQCRLTSGDRMLMVSDGIVSSGDGGAGVGIEATIEAALRSREGSASDTVREVHRTVLAASKGGNLADDATAVCLAAG